MGSTGITSCPLRAQVDPRALRFSATASTRTALEDARPARFAHLIGFVLTAAALLAFATGVDGAGYALTAVALVGAAIHATTGACLGCSLYLLARPRQS